MLQIPTNNDCVNAMPFLLPQAPPGYATDLVLILSPYFDLWFAEQIVHRFKPHRLRYLVDDGARLQDVEQLTKCNARDLKIALGAAPGVMHLKIYYFEFLKRGPRRLRKRHVIFGSANATEAAFCGSINAELIADAELSPTEDAAILDYLKLVLNAIETEGGFVGGKLCKRTRRIPKILLPPIRIEPIGPPPAFDAWLQRGRLVAKYRDAQQFLSISVNLKKPLPPGTVAREFANSGLIQPGEPNTVRYRYMNQPGDSDESLDDLVPRWKAKFCVWTHLGDWVSDDCYFENKSVMAAQSKPRRQAKITELLEKHGDRDWKASRKQQFLDALTAVWDGLLAAEFDPGDYLDGGGTIDREAYGMRFERKLASDFLQARDQNFRDRYINGYEFAKVPKFRHDANAWEEFAESWCDSILIESLKRTQSLATKAVRDALDVEVLASLTPRELGAKLRTSWGNTDVGAKIEAKYEDGFFYPAVIEKIANQSGQKRFFISFDDGGEEIVLGPGDVRSLGQRLVIYFHDADG